METNSAGRLVRSSNSPAITWGGGCLRFASPRRGNLGRVVFASCNAQVCKDDRCAFRKTVLVHAGGMVFPDCHTDRVLLVTQNHCESGSRRLLTYCRHNINEYSSDVNHVRNFVEIMQIPTNTVCRSAGQLPSSCSTARICVVDITYPYTSRFVHCHCMFSPMAL